MRLENLILKTEWVITVSNTRGRTMRRLALGTPRKRWAARHKHAAKRGYRVNLHACSVARLCLTLCNPTDWGPPGSSVHGISQARVLDWVCHFLLQGIFPTQGSNLCLLRLLLGTWILYHCATWEVHKQWIGTVIIMGADITSDNNVLRKVCILVVVIVSVYPWSRINLTFHMYTIQSS